MTLPRTAGLALALAVFLVPDLAQAKKKEKPGRGRAKATAPASVPGCKEPAPRDPDLVAGLAAYGRGEWSAAAAQLGTWAAKPGAEQDPAAGRGMYAYAYASRAATRLPEAGQPAMMRAETLLLARTQSDPTLEGWYYLQGIHQMRGDAQAQLAVVADALKAIEAGTACATRDGDDWFRLGRLYAFAGNNEKKSECLNAAAAAYAALPPDAPASPYRGLTEKELGDAALTSNDLATAETRFALAARLDPTIPGVHRQLGLVYLRRDKLQEAAAHWRGYWKREREGGNAFMYAVPIINKVLAYRAKPGIERLTGLSAYTVPALEQGALSEARTFLELKQEAAASATAPFPPEKQAQMEAAEYRMSELLLEYITRGQDVQEFALQNGLLPAIHGGGLPAR